MIYSCLFLHKYDLKHQQLFIQVLKLDRLPICYPFRKIIQCFKYLCVAIACEPLGVSIHSKGKLDSGVWINGSMFVYQVWYWDRVLLKKRNLKSLDSISWLSGRSCTNREQSTLLPSSRITPKTTPRTRCVIVWEDPGVPCHPGVV